MVLNVHRNQTWHFNIHRNHQAYILLFGTEGGGGGGGGGCLTAKQTSKGPITLHQDRAQEVCESRGGCSGLLSRINRMDSVDVKQH